MKKRAAKHLHFRQPGEPMFDDQFVDASQIEDRRPKHIEKAVMKAVTRQAGLPVNNAGISGGVGAKGGGVKKKRSRPTRRVPD